ncbi:ABC transporter ATP-binding protein [Methylobacterium sp. A54F]
MSTAISVQGLGKEYRRAPRAAHQNSLRDALGDGLRRLGDGLRRPAGRRASPARESFWALRDANFEIARGETVGIIGLNGAGKSTLLKMLSRIVTPSEGRARITGRLGALLEVGTGFHQELSGRENIFLYGSILGMDREEILKKFDAIVEFSEIGAFIDMPVKRYSSGMYVRLAFSVAAHLEPDILLLDEVLAVGDYSFQKKCMDLAHRLERSGATILLVSHNMFSIKTMCSRVIYIRKGRIAYDGPTDEGLRLYEADSYLAAPTWFRDDGTAPVDIRGIEVLDEADQPRTLFEPGERLRVRVHYGASQPVRRPNVRISLTRSDDVLCCNYSTLLDGVGPLELGTAGTVELTTGPLSLTAASYAVSVTLLAEDAGRPLAARLGPRFHVADPDLEPDVFGVFHESGAWLHRQGPLDLLTGTGEPGGR